jgi:hypothetical protein
VLRVIVSERGQPELPAIDVDAQTIVIGSSTTAHVRLPVAAGAELRVAAAEIGEGAVFEIGPYRVRVAPAPPGVTPSPPQRTESLARELLRSLLGTGAPALEVEQGPNRGARKVLPPPEVIVVIGRGDDAHWVIADEDLSRAHAEVRRGWDGVTLRDLDSQNGTFVDGTRVKGAVALRDGATIALGRVVLRFVDPAERHLSPATKPLEPVRVERAPTSKLPFAIAVAISGLAIAALVYVLVS